MGYKEFETRGGVAFKSQDYLNLDHGIFVVWG